MEVSEEEAKLLISKTKKNILKSLLERRKMLSELAFDLELSPPTVKEHITSLAKANFVVKKEEGRKWKYYELTKKGKDIVSEEKPSITVILMFIVPLVLIVGGIIAGQLPFVGGLMASKASMAADASSAVAFETAGAAIETTAVTPGLNYQVLIQNILMILGVFGLIGAVIYYEIKKK